MHLAARVGGISANQRNPGRFSYNNMSIGLNIIKKARLYGRQEKLVFIGTTSSYPRFTPVTFNEYDLWNGHLEETIAPYGIAKRALLSMLRG